MSREARVIPLRREPSREAALSDAALLASCGSGDMEALAVLYERHAEGVSRFLARLRHVDEHEAEDLVHEVFLAARRTAPSYRSDCAVRTWLLAIAGNLARTHARSQLRRRAAFEHVGHEVRLALVSADVEQLAVEHEQMRRLADALDALPHELRVAYVLCELEGVAGVEAARVLGVPEGTLYRRLHDARKQLRAAIEGGRPC